MSSQGYKLQFTSTRQDLVDARRVVEAERTGMRPWLRHSLGVLGVVWLLGTIAILALGREVKSWYQPLAWLVIAGGLTWAFAVRPIFAAMKLRRAAPNQPLQLIFDDGGIDITAEGVGSFHRSWDDVTAVIPAETGIVMSFFDGVVHWLPCRAFRDPSQQSDFLAFVQRHLPDSSGSS